MPVQSSEAYIALPSTLNDSTWFLDSGATHHITSNENSLTTISDYSGKSKLALGDGSALSISHIGHGSLPSSKPLKLRNILLVPSITKNLISISKFTLENHVIVECDYDCCYVKDKQTKEILLQGILKDGLYQLCLPNISSDVSPSAYNNSLCSSNSQFLQSFSSSNVVPSFPNDAHKKASKNQQIASFSCIDFSGAHTACKNASENNSSSCNSQNVMSLWHSRLGHPNKLALKQFLSQLHVKIPSSTMVEFCEACQ